MAESTENADTEQQPANPENNDNDPNTQNKEDNENREHHDDGNNKNDENKENHDENNENNENDKSIENDENVENKENERDEAQENDENKEEINNDDPSNEEQSKEEPKDDIINKNEDENENQDQQQSEIEDNDIDENKENDVNKEEINNDDASNIEQSKKEPNTEKSNEPKDDTQDIPSKDEDDNENQNEPQLQPEDNDIDANKEEINNDDASNIEQSKKEPNTEKSNEPKEDIQDIPSKDEDDNENQNEPQSQSEDNDMDENKEEINNENEATEDIENKNEDENENEDQQQSQSEENSIDKTESFDDNIDSQTEEKPATESEKKEEPKETEENASNSEPQNVETEQNEDAMNKDKTESFDDNEENIENEEEEKQDIYTYGNVTATDYTYGSQADEPENKEETQPKQEEDVEEVDGNKENAEQIESQEQQQEDVEEEDDVNKVNEESISYSEDVEQEQDKEEARDAVTELNTDIQREELSMSPMSPRVTKMKEELFSKRRFDGNGLPLVVCLRCNNHFFVEKKDEHFTATARKRNLKYSFTLIQDPIDDDVFQLIHIESASYLSVKKMGQNWTLYAVNNDDITSIDRQDLSFTIIKISDDKEANLRVTIGWNDKFLTIKDADNTFTMTPSKNNKNMDNAPKNASIASNLQELGDDDNGNIDEEEKEENKNNDVGIAPELGNKVQSLAHLDGTDKVLLFDSAYIENIDDQVFILERILDDVDDSELDIVFLLDLVDEPRASKIGIPKLKKYKHIPFELSELIQQIYVRLDVNKIGYAQYNLVWSQFVQYSQGLVPRVVINAFEEGVTNSNLDLDSKLIHIKNFIVGIDTIIEFYENEIKMEQLEQEKEAALKELDPIDIKLRRLDSDILYQHPFLLEWQNMSRFRRKLYDYQVWIKDKWNSGAESIGFFLWRKHLVAIQGNFGESIFAFFQFTRWLMILNLIMALFYGILIFTHCWNFSWFNYSYSNYIDMALGNEFTNSWWFYGAYKSDYPHSMISFNIAFSWIAVSVGAAIISVVAVLRILLNVGSNDSMNDEFIFSNNVFANYHHSLQHEDAVTLQTNSLMIRLHETLLQRLDDEGTKLSFILILRRIIGIILCLIIGALSAVGIAALIYFEKDLIVPYAKDIHPSMQSAAPYIVPAGVSVIKAMTPHIVKAVVLFERYSAEFLFQQTFFRVFLLRIFAILVTLFQTAQTAEDAEINDSEAPCAESQIGMVLYKFILFDMILEVIFYLIVPSVKYCCGRCCGSIKKLTKEEELQELNRKSTANNDDNVAEFELAGDSWKAEFDIPGGLVDVMYRQGIVWSGMYFSPMIPILAVIASIITFFLKKRYLFNYCGRPKKALGVTKQLKFFYGMMLLAIIVSFVPFNYFLNRTPNCGPHKKVNVLNETETTLDDDMPTFLQIFFSYAFNGLLLLPLFILTLVYLGYIRGVKKSYIINSKQLKQRLLKEKDEKKQILKDYNIRL